MGKGNGIFFDTLACHVFRIGLVGVIALPVFEMIGSCVFSSGSSFGLRRLIYFPYTLGRS
jgi:hypothetical protein